MDELERLQELVARAKAGDQTTMPELRKLMEQRTDICQALGDAHNESLACWIKRYAGDDQVWFPAQTSRRGELAVFEDLAATLSKAGKESVTPTP